MGSIIDGVDDKKIVMGIYFKDGSIDQFLVKIKKGEYTIYNKNLAEYIREAPKVYDVSELSSIEFLKKHGTKIKIFNQKLYDEYNELQLLRCI